jgi:phage gp45-like
MSLLLAKMEVMEHRILALAGGGSSLSSSLSSSRGGDRVPGLKAGDIDRLRKEGKCFRCKKTGHMKSECPSTPKSGNF